MCSEDSCELKAIKDIWIHGESPFTNRRYRMQVYVCKYHYEIEKESGTIIKEKSLQVANS